MRTGGGVAFALDAAATLDLAAGVTPSGALKQAAGLRPDNAPIIALPLADPIDTITLDGAQIPAIGMKQVLTPADAKVLGTWKDGTAAVTAIIVTSSVAFDRPTACAMSASARCKFSA